MVAASVSPTTSAPVIDSAATMSSPRSPRRRLVTISATSASSTGTVTAAQIAGDQALKPGELDGKAGGEPERHQRGEKLADSLERAGDRHRPIHRRFDAAAAMTKIKCRRLLLWT